MRKLVISLVLAALAGLALPSTAGAIVNPLEIELLSPTAPLSFSVTMPSVMCNDDSLSVDEVFDGNDDPVEPVSFTPHATDSNVGTLVLPDDTVPGTITVSARCLVGDATAVATGIVSIAAVEVTKVVVGTAPPGSTFTVHADCVDTIIVSQTFGEAGAAELPDDFGADLSFPAAGGLAHLYSDHAVACTLTEPQNGGASSVTFDPEVVEITAPTSYAATVTNTFAEPIVVEPTFTG